MQECNAEAGGALPPPRPRRAALLTPRKLGRRGFKLGEGGQCRCANGDGAAARGLAVLCDEATPSSEGMAAAEGKQLVARGALRLAAYARGWRRVVRTPTCGVGPSWEPAVCRQAQHRQVGHLVVRAARRLGPRAVQGSEAFAHPRREGRADEGVDPRVASGGGAAGGGGVRGRRRRIEHRMQVGRRPLQHAWKVHRRRPPQRGPEARHVQDEFRLQRLQRREPAAREQVLLRARCSDAARARSQVWVEVEVRLCCGGAAWGWAELWYGGWDCGTPGARPSR